MVRGQQIGRLGVGARDDQRRYPADIRREARGDQLLHGFLRRYQYLAAHVTAFLDRRQLVLEMHAARA